LRRSTRILAEKQSVTKQALLVAATLALASTMAMTQGVPMVTGDARVDKLLSQMTLNEKLTLTAHKRTQRFIRARPATSPGLPALAFQGCALPMVRREY
jgi:hypothetical protein